MDGQIVRHSLHEALVAPIREMIRAGELRPGDKIHEESLCARFGVSRTPIREAVKVLAAEGVLVITPHRGAAVARVSREQVDELFPIMAGLERLAGRLACAHATKADVARLVALNDKMVAAFRAGEEGRYLSLNRKMHEALFAIAGNVTLTLLYQQILTRIHSCRFVMRKSAAHWAAAMAEHEEMMAALEARDGERLGAILEHHVAVTTAGIAHAFIDGVGDEGARAPASGRGRPRRAADAMAGKAGRPARRASPSLP